MLYSCLEYDLWTECRVDLAGFWQHKYSVRKLIMWVRGLPSTSMLGARGFAGDDRWGKNEELLATVADYVHILTYLFAKANGGKNLGKVELIDRPDLTVGVE